MRPLSAKNQALNDMRGEFENLSMSYEKAIDDVGRIKEDVRVFAHTLICEDDILDMDIFYMGDDEDDDFCC